MFHADPSFMNILFYSSNFKPMDGGVAEHTHQYVKYFHDRSHSVTVVAPEVEESQSFDEEQPYDIYRIRRWPRPIGYGFFFIFLVKLLYKEEIDVVYCPVWYPLGLYAALLRPLTSIRLVIAVHGWEVEHGWGSFVQPFQVQSAVLQRPVFRTADAVVAVSEWTRERVLSNVSNRVDVYVVNNGVLPEQFECAETLEMVDGVDISHRRVLLTVARLVPRKGHDTVIRALPGILEEHPDTVYLVAGDGPRRSELESLSESVGVEDNVVFLGYVPESDLPDLYNTADLFVMPNRREGTSVEGFGIVFLEANAAGTPVIGGNHGGVPDAIVDDVTGRLIDPYSPEEFAATTIELLDTPEAAVEMGQQGLERVRSEFTWNHSGAELEEIFRRLSQ
jgi:phosphatidylinositol alpha-1,6-mannosyltransferase